jgi:hypothetical protein
MRILFNWYYHRPDLTRHLLEAGAEHELHFIDRHAQDSIDLPPATIHYWGDFASPYGLLDAVRPDKIVFSDIEAFHQLALNVAARNRGIPTLVLQHGSRGAFELDLAVREPQRLALSGTSAWSARFLASALRPKNLLALPALSRFVYERKRYELTAALQRNRFELRRADRYIEFSHENAGYHRSRDGVPEHRFTYIGNPTLDELFTRVPSYVPRDYALLLDAPFLEAGGFTQGRISPEQKADYLVRLDRLCALQGLRLVAKLHPLTYDAALPALPNTDYVRNGDLPRLVGESRLTISVHYSTLSAPVQHLRPFYAFDSGEAPPAPFHGPAGVQPMNLWGFDPETVGAPLPPLPWSAVEEYLFAKDGRAGERLKNVLF